MLSNKQLKTALSKSPGERVTKEYIESRIANVRYTILEESTVTVCSITIDNGFSVRGEAACVDPLNFNKDIGERTAYDDAFKKLWPLFGFLLAEQRHLQNA